MAETSFSLPKFAMFYLAATDGKEMDLPRPFDVTAATPAGGAAGAGNPLPGADRAKAEMVATAGALRRSPSRVEFSLPSEGDGTVDRPQTHEDWAQLLCDWLNANFTVGIKPSSSPGGGNGVKHSIQPLEAAQGPENREGLLVDCAFRCIRGSSLFIAMGRTKKNNKLAPEASAGAPGVGGDVEREGNSSKGPLHLIIRIYHDDAGLIGQVLQSMCSFMNITELSSKAHLPTEMEIFTSVISRVEQVRFDVRMKSSLRRCLNSGFSHLPPSHAPPPPPPPPSPPSSTRSASS